MGDSREEEDAWAAMARFQTQAVAPPADAAPVDPIVEAFQRGKEPAARSGALCSQRCANMGWMQAFDHRRPNLFGCAEHGSVHECAWRDCRTTFTHPAGHITCIYSGATMSFATIYRGAFGDHEVETTTLDDDDDEREFDVYEGPKPKKSKRAPCAAPGPTAEPAAPALRRISNVDRIASDVLAVFFANNDGRQKILDVLLRRARDESDRRIAALRKKSVIRVGGRVVVDACLVPRDDVLYAVFEEPFRALAEQGGVYPWPAAPVALAVPTCAQDDYLAISDWLRSSILHLWKVLERHKCCKNAVAAFHALCVYVAHTVAAGKPVEVHLYGRRDVLIPASARAQRCGIPHAWVKLIDHLSTPTCFVHTSQHSDGHTALMEMLNKLADKTSETVYMQMRTRLHEIHANYERPPRVRPQAATRARGAEPAP